MAESSNRGDKWVTGEVPTTAAGSGITQNVGHNIVSTYIYTGADVSTNLADCTTGAGSISSPGAWTDIVDFAIGEPIEVVVGPTTPGSGYYPIQAVVDAAEDANDAIRIQVLVDSVIVGDITVTKDSADASGVIYGPVEYYSSTAPYVAYKFHCDSSFKVRATRNGTFADATTQIRVGQATYNKFQ